MLGSGDAPTETCFRLLPRRHASRYEIPATDVGRDVVGREDVIQLCGVSCRKSAMYEVDFMSTVGKVTGDQALEY